MTPLPSLSLHAGGTRVEVVPGRGALVTRMEVDGEPVLFLDPATLADPTRSVRGGIPLLFPIAGRLEGDRYRVDGREYALKQHGFARDLAWEAHPEGPARLRLALASSPETLARFPFPFAAEVLLEVSPRRLQLAFTLRNPDAARPLPLHFGLHPYFHVPQGAKGQARVETDATRAWDNRARTHTAFTGLPLEAEEVDLHLLDHTAPGTTLHRGEGRAPLRLTWSPAFRTLVVWTLAGRDFVCVEPWTAPAGALATGEGLQEVPPGGSTTLAFGVEAL
jgi:galactose mutarotase-like enzyme